MQQINPGLAHLAVDVATLSNDPKNARMHDERSVTSIMSSLREFGQQKPIVALDDGTVIAGNGTLEAARRLGWVQIAVVRFADHKTARAYAIADNRSSELSTWNGEALADALREIQGQEIDLASVGFSEMDVERLLVGPGENDPHTEWADGMPEYTSDDKTALQQIKVNFASREDVEAFAKLIGQNITDKTRSIWFPPAKIEHWDRRYKEPEK